MKNKPSSVFTRILATLFLLISVGLCPSDKLLPITTAADSNPWSTKAPMPTARSSPMSAVINGLLYVVGGSVSSTYLRVLEVYNPATNTWATKSARPTANGVAAIGAIDGKLYVAGGTTQVGNNYQVTNVLEVYDPATDTWSSKAAMPTGRRASAGAVIDGKLYVVGGDTNITDYRPTGILEVYDPATDTWGAKAPMPTPRGYFSVQAINGKLYVAGGRVSGTLPTNILEVYDPVTNSWTTRASMPTTRDVFGSGVINERLYVVGGAPNRNLTQTSANESYDPVTNTWRSEPSILTARWGMGMGVISNTLYAVGGAISPSDVVLQTNEAFDPPRDLSVVSVTASPSGTATVPIALLSQGNENAIGFSLTYNTSILSNPQVSLGSDASGAVLNPNSSQTAQGRLGIAISLPAGQTFSEGVRRIVNVTFAVAANTAGTTTQIGFGDQPIRREIVDTSASALASTYTQGIVAITPGYEADVSPRPNGNNNETVTIADWVQVGRFAAGVDTAALGSEFQRADCSPKETKGDGRMSIADWVQAGRYAADVDTVVTAGGPTAPVSGLQSSLQSDESLALVAESQQATRAIRAMSASLERGQNGTLAIEIDAQGNENALGFSVNFDATQLRFVSASAGSGANGATLNVNSNQAANGRLGIALALPTNQVFAAGTKQLVVLTFAALSNGNGGTAAVTLGDQPVAREIVDAAANSLNANWVAATVTLTRTVASVSAASYKAEALAADAIVAAFGANLATRQQTAASLPLPTTLGGTTVSVRDAAGIVRNAPLFFVSPTQVNYLVPSGTAAGQATVTVTSSDQIVTIGKVNIAATAPGLFAANANGQGVAAALALRIKANGSQSYEPIARYDVATNRFVPVPIDLTDATDQVFLILYGTGIRGRSSLASAVAALGGAASEVLFAGAQGELAGLDQLNLRLPRSLAGRGEVNVTLSVDGIAANVVTVSVK